MKYLSIVLSSIALILAGILFYQYQTQNTKLRGLVTEVRSGDTAQAKVLKIAYVDLDSIDARFEFYKGKIEAFEKKKDGLDRQLNGAYQQLDKRRIDFLQKGNAITQAEADAFKKEYDQQLQYLENQRRKTEQDVQQEAMIMRDDIFKKINDYLSGYCKERGYTYVFSYSRNANIFLYEDPVFNITEDVIAGLNTMYKNEDKKK
ncbi:OmpH family outer membrane protein [Agriterribacter sp.]|uniref:OmpH family outer membrane protein n=1 Tax=Agriterribacter sp. TaxID=2821509 RepID=UPI002B940F4F|nr:OmpH family outer membrane protein [Agriterribacter sp.]HRO46852.1 OmpH family outer membrane protein [Agriterribacter sp.]HRQ18065.1 OmpH family outer membrane protein [Agriterribacter sp.]